MSRSMCVMSKTHPSFLISFQRHPHTNSSQSEKKIQTCLFRSLNIALRPTRIPEPNGPPRQEIHSHRPTLSRAHGNQLAARSTLTQLLFVFTGREMDSASEMFMSYGKYCSARLVYVIPLSFQTRKERRERGVTSLSRDGYRPHHSTPPPPPPPFLPLPLVNSCTSIGEWATD